MVNIWVPACAGTTVFFIVIPAKAGIHRIACVGQLGPGLRRDDGLVVPALPAWAGAATFFAIPAG
ncbi:MAG TPA: hypothetical protein VFY97_11765 [Rhodanobacteraceae bacterium]|nr:hypothetical protein [Rhodanobacteraceae bacterium]